MRSKWECMGCGNMISVLTELERVVGPKKCSCDGNVFKHINTEQE